MPNGQKVVNDLSEVALSEINTEILLKFQKDLLETFDFDVLVQKIIYELPDRQEFQRLGYRFVVLALADKEKQILKHIFLSKALEGEKEDADLNRALTSIDVPFSAKDNLCIKIYISQKAGVTNNWPDIFTPPLLKEQVIQLQQSLGIKSSIIYPIVAKGESLGILIFNICRDISLITEQEKGFLSDFADVVGLGIKNAQLVSSLTNTTKNLQQANIQIRLMVKLQRDLLEILDYNQVVEKVVNELLKQPGIKELGYRIIVLTLVDEQKSVLRRISLSSTFEAVKALNVSAIPFHEIAIPLTTENNILIKCLREQKSMITHNWPEMFIPVLTAEQALANQKSAGIKTSIIYPIIVGGKSIGALIFSLVRDVEQISEGEELMLSALSDGVGIAVQNTLFVNSIRKVTEDLQKTNERLKELDHLKDDFVSLASHELRTPMTAIKSYLWMAIAGKGGALNEKQMYYVQRSYKSVDRLIKLVNDMLNISRIESGRLTVQMQAVKIEQLVRETIDELGPRVSELGITIVFDNKDNIPEVLVDPDKIKEVIYNLIGNSMKFTPKDGGITVSLVQKDKMVEVAVKDTGSGIAPEDLTKLFQKFGILSGTYVTNQAVSGTGLGLYICRSLVELHGGKIWATSEGKGKGTTFAFSLKVFNQEDLNKYNEKNNHQAEEKVGLIHTQIA